jgi:hypothetical protein
LGHHATMFAVLVQLHSLNASLQSPGTIADGPDMFTMALTATAGAAGGSASPRSKLAGNVQLSDVQLEEKQRSKCIPFPTVLHCFDGGHCTRLGLHPS